MSLARGERREETPGTSPHALSKKLSVAQGAPFDVPAPMETGGAGDSWSWAEWAKASADEAFPPMGQNVACGAIRLQMGIIR